MGKIKTFKLEFNINHILGIFYLIVWAFIILIYVNVSIGLNDMPKYENVGLTLLGILILYFAHLMYKISDLLFERAREQK